MAYDPVLAERIRAELSRHVEFTEKRMFGGLSFLVNGNMCCGITGSDLVLRLTPEGAERALEQPHTRPMDFTGKPMKSMVYVSAEGTASAVGLSRWVSTAASTTKELAPKKPSARKSKGPLPKR